jgi:uncharacterized protein DUF3553
LNIVPGSYVTHSKLPELGSGEVLSAQEGLVSIRFASGDRTFKHELVMRFLTVTSEAPLLIAPQKRAASRARKMRSKIAATKH